MNVQYRDVRYAVPFLVQAWMFATPVAYPSSLLSEPWRTIYGLNPWLESWKASAGRCWGKYSSGSDHRFSSLASVAILISGAIISEGWKKHLQVGLMRGKIEDGR